MFDAMNTKISGDASFREGDVPKNGISQKNLKHIIIWRRGIMYVPEKYDFDLILWCLMSRSTII